MAVFTELLGGGRGGLPSPPSTGEDYCAAAYTGGRLLACTAGAAILTPY